MPRKKSLLDLLLNTGSSTSSGRTKWRAELKHEGLNKYKIITGYDKNEVEQKAEALSAQWEEMWQKKQEKERIKTEKEENIKNALERTKDTQKEIFLIESILNDSIDNFNQFTLDSELDEREFDLPKPTLELEKVAPKKPNEDDDKYKVKFKLFDKLSKKRKEKKLEEANRLYQDDLQKWNNEISRIENTNNEIRSRNNELLQTWKKEKDDYYKKQEIHNKHIEQLKKDYDTAKVDAIEQYFDIALNSTYFPTTLNRDLELQYKKEQKTLIVNYILPNIEEIPTLKEVKYIQSRNEFKEVYNTQSNTNQLYDSSIYQIALKILNEVYLLDKDNHVESVVFNGWVDTIDKSTGQNIKPCIISIQTIKDEFININLKQVDPKSCFKSLKGVGSSKLHSIAPIRPILQIDREDSRFIEAYDVAKYIDDSTNIAAMDWEDFEHLVREIFEKEFSQTGGEVKITQASRDQGVDAVAFDPDPIRGGKIVIQAKRYTNTVPVAAVRDLYGTVVNEGAIKGILITTSDYGPDSITFAKDKPITLLNGGELLYLLSKHGYKAKIDINEAKQILKDKEG